MFILNLQNLNKFVLGTYLEKEMLLSFLILIFYGIKKLIIM